MEPVAAAKRAGLVLTTAPAPQVKSAKRTLVSQKSVAATTSAMPSAAKLAAPAPLTAPAPQVKSVKTTLASPQRPLVEMEPATQPKARTAAPARKIAPVLRGRPVKIMLVSRRACASEGRYPISRSPRRHRVVQTFFPSKMASSTSVSKRISKSILRRGTTLVTILSTRLRA